MKKKKGNGLAWIQVGNEAKHKKFLERWQPRKAEMEAMYWQKGMLIKEIAMYYGSPATTLYSVFSRLGIPTRSRSEYMAGERNCNWAGGKYKTKRGYVMVMCVGHPRALRSRYVFEHILVWEKYHKVRLPKNYIIHHINGIKDDNRIGNLVALRGSQHKKLLSLMCRRIKKLEDENTQLRQRVMVL